MVIEVELTSGYKPNIEGFKAEIEYETDKSLVKLIEYKDETNTVAMYFDEMPKRQICFELETGQFFPVQSTQPSIAKIYDYYDQTDVFSVEYQNEGQSVNEEDYNDY